MEQPSSTALTTQLAELNNRVRMYVNRMWHMPFAYLLSSGVTYFNLTSAGNPRFQLIVTIAFLGFGGMVSLSLMSIQERVNQTVNDIEEIEKLLNLKVTVVPQNRERVWPYYLMAAMGIFMSISIIGRILLSEQAS